MPDANDLVIIRVETPQDEEPRLTAEQQLPPGRTTRMSIGEMLALGGLSGYALLERRGDDQDTNLSAGDHLEFNNFAAASGVSVSNVGPQNQGNGLIELESAGTWLLICWIDAVFSMATGQVNLVWRDNTAGQLLSRSEAIIRPPTSAVNAATNQVCATILDVATPVQVECRMTVATNLTLISESDSGGMRALILKLAS